MLKFICNVHTSDNKYNFSSKSYIKDVLNIVKTYVETNNSGRYKQYLDMIFDVAKEIEDLTETNNVLTSNKFWEVVIAVELNHNVNSEQGGRGGAHDAYDQNLNE